MTADTGLTSLDQFREMVVKAEGGSLVRLSDIATVDLGAQSTNSSVMMSGERAVFIGIQATPTGNPLNIVRDVRALAAHDRARPAADGEDEHRLRLDEVHQFLDQRGRAAR